MYSLTSWRLSLYLKAVKRFRNKLYYSLFILFSHTPVKCNLVTEIFILFVLFEKLFDIKLYFAIEVVKIVFHIGDKHPTTLRQTVLIIMWNVFYTIQLVRSTNWWLNKIGWYYKIIFKLLSIYILLLLGLYDTWGWKEYMNKIPEFFLGSSSCCKFQQFLHSGILLAFSAYQGRSPSQLFPSGHLIYNVLLQKVELGLKWGKNYDHLLQMYALISKLTDGSNVNKSLLSFSEVHNPPCCVFCSR